MPELTMVVHLDATGASVPRFWDAKSGAAIASHMPTRMPTAIDSGQAYYWKYAWQLGEQRSRADMAAGRTRSFPDAQELIRWLLSEED